MMRGEALPSSMRHGCLKVARHSREVATGGQGVPRYSHGSIDLLVSVRMTHRCCTVTIRRCELLSLCGCELLSSVGAGCSALSARLLTKHTCGHA